MTPLVRGLFHQLPRLAAEGIGQFAQGRRSGIAAVFEAGNGQPLHAGTAGQLLLRQRCLEAPPP